MIEALVKDTKSVHLIRKPGRLYFIVWTRDDEIETRQMASDFLASRWAQQIADYLGRKLVTVEPEDAEYEKIRALIEA